MTRIFFALAMLVLIAPTADADYDSATAAYNSGDRNAAFMEFSRLSLRGHAKAQFMLGTQYLNGEGVLQDYVQAHKWLNLASSAGHPLAAEYRDRAATMMTLAQVAEAQQLARQWRPKKGRKTANDSVALSGVTPPVTSNAPVTRRGNTVARIQRILNAHGYDAGPADGKTGAKTRKAIRRYQAQTGLFQDGEATPSLLTFLEAQYPQDSATGATADTSTASPAPLAQSATPTAGSQADTRLPQLVAELRRLTRDAERSRAANKGFLDQLQDLLSRYDQDWPWHRLLLNEPFSDAGYVRNSAWQITSGDFYLNRGEGLQSRVSPPPVKPKPRKQSNKELAINLLGSLLGAQGGGNNTSSTNPEPRGAAIHISQQVSNSFALRLKLNAHSATAEVIFSLYQGFDRQAGYRLSYTPGSPGLLQLLKVTNRGEILIASDNRAVDLADEVDHDLLWSRDGKGAMRVSIDGHERLRGTDSSQRGDFEGFSFVNRGGDYTLKELRLYGVH